MLPMYAWMYRQALQYKKPTKDHIIKKKVFQFSGKIYIQQIISKSEGLDIIYTMLLTDLVSVMLTQKRTAIMSS